jgi:hypothetical protein
LLNAVEKIMYVYKLLDHSEIDNNSTVYWDQ